MKKNEALKYYREHQKKVNAYTTVLSCAYYDKETIAPVAGNSYRNECMGYMYGEAFTIETDPKYIECVNVLSKEKLDSATKRDVELSQKALENIIKFTKEDVMEFDMAQMQSFDAWQVAKRTDNYQLYKPHLLKLIELSKKRAKIRNDKKDPYDLYLDDYEEGMTKKKYDEFFSLVRKELVPVIKGVSENQDRIDDSFLYKFYPKEKQEIFMKEIHKYLGFDPSWGYMGVSEHPFTMGISHNDVRITTAYNEHNITSSIFSVIHECGHAFYEHQVDKKYEGTNILRSISSGMHESQSRFFENYLGRRKSFWVTLYPKLQKLFPENLKDVSLDDFVKAINVAKPSLIRTDADELTYPMHIVVRYEIEKSIFENTADLENLDKIWKDKYKELLGVDVPTDREGILQDVHWSDASFGYFPTYALGSAIGAQLLHKMEKDIPLDEYLSKGQFKKVTDYLKNNLQKYGAMYDYNTLLKMVTGETFKPKYYISYLKKKYTSLYGLKH